MEQLPSLISRHAWPAVAAVVILVVARAAKEPAVGSPLARIPVRWRPHVVLALGVLSGVLNAVVAGKAWGDAILENVLSAAVAIAVHGWAGGVNPAPPRAQGELPRPSAGDVEPAPVELFVDGLPVPPAAPTPDRTSPPAQPIVEPAERWGPMPRPNER